MFEARNIAYQRGGRQLFHALSFRIEHGQSLQIKGENGAGKSSLLKLLTGISHADEGEILWQGKNIKDDVQFFYSDLLFIGHRTGVNGHLTAVENLTWYQKIHTSGTTSGITDELLKSFGLYGFEDIPAAKLSAGQQRRIALCRLMIEKKTLWLLDEPLVSLDYAGVQLFQKLLEKHLEDGGMAIFTSHQDLSIEARRINSLDLNVYKSQEVGELV